MNAGMRPIPGAIIHASHHSKTMDGVIEHHGTKKGMSRKTARKAYEG